MSEPKSATCPDCSRTMTIEDRAGEGVRVVIDGKTPPGPCCQKYATQKYTRTGIFITKP